MAAVLEAVVSKRRSVGEQVWLSPCSGFCWHSNHDAVVIQPAESNELKSCPLDCGDPECREWPDVLTVDGQRYYYHVSECEMFDTYQESRLMSA